MEGLRGLETLLAYALGLGMFLALVGAYILLWRWMWKQRGIGFAEGWYEVAERRAHGTAGVGFSGVPSSGRGKGEAVPEKSGVHPQPPAPEPTKRAPAGPPRYLVPIEKE
jgi:hypothetical protein